MIIVEIKSYGDGVHRNQSGDNLIVPDGWAIVAPECTIPDSFPLVDIHIENGFIVGMTPRLETQQTPLSHEEINSMIVAKIREKYDVNEEFKMINLGIIDSNNKEYMAYREYVQECIDWGNSLEEGGDV